jgi:radical SAM protein (TIGR01212 family)
MYTTPYYTYREFMIDRYGDPLQRIPIDLGFGCPNRDADGRGGCAFCAEHGGRAQQTRQATDWRNQIDTAVAFARNRYDAQRFMGYCQAYSGTFADLDEQRDCFAAILAHTQFDAFTVGTRPDCLDADTIDLLGALRTETDVWVELGVQTAHDDTLCWINRGHDWACSRDAILRLHAAGIPCAVHVIFGLPGETERHYHKTAAALGELPIDGIKIHNLHVIRGTQLAVDYLAEPFPVLDEHDYAEAVIDAIRLMPPHIPIIRLQTDTPDEDLIAPRWQMKKSQFVDYVTLQMQKRGIRQGDGRE